MKQKHIYILLIALIVGGGLFAKIGASDHNHAYAEDAGGDADTGGDGKTPLVCKGETPYYVNGKCQKCPSGQKEDSAGKCQLDNPSPGQLVDTKDFGELLQKLINIFLMFAGAIAVIFLMVGGFQYVASRGNEEATEKAKKTVTNAVIGVVLIVMSFAIVNIVNTLLTKPSKEQAGTSKAPGPSGGPGGGGGQTQGGITVKAVDLRDFYTEADLITITFTADPSDSYSWGDNAPPNLGIELEASSDGLTAQLIWRARRGDAGKYNITVTATSDRGKAGSTTVLIDVREPGQSEP